MNLPFANHEKTASFAALLLLILGCYKILQPFVFDMLWSAILCFVTWPIFQRLLGWRFSPHWAAATMVLPIGVLLLTPFATAALSLSDDIERFLRWLSDGNHVWPAPPIWLQQLPLIGEQLQQRWRDLGENSAQLVAVIRPYALSAGSWMVKQGVGLAGELMHMGLSILMLYFFYRDGERVANHAIQLLRRLAGEQSQRIIDIVGTGLRAVVYGILGTALVQALAAMLGFIIAGVPYAFELGVVAFFLMIIPAAGTLVWLPISGWLLINGETGWAIFIAGWFLLFVGTIDNWLRPILISREVDLPFVLIVLGIFGGLLAFGFIGVFLGPTLLATSYALLLDWLIRREQNDNAQP